MSSTGLSQRIGRHTLIYGVGVLLSRAIGFIMLPVYTRYLTPADYGTLQLLVMVLEVVSIVAGSRLAAGIFYYFHKAESEAEKHAVLSTAAIVLALSYGFVAALTYVVAPTIANAIFETESATKLVRIAAGGLASEGLLLVPLAYLQVRERSSAYVAVTTVKLVVQLGLNIYFVVVLRRGAEGVLWSTLISNSVIGASLSLVLIAQVGTRFSSRAMRDLVRFGLPMVATQVATFVMTFGDRYFLNKAADTAAVGLYGLAYQFGFLLFALAYTPFNSVWEPVRFAIAKRPDRDQVYAAAFVYFNILLITLAVGIALFVSDFLNFAAAPAFRPAAALVPVILAAYVLQAWTGIHNVGIQMRERNEYITTANWIAAGVALVGYVVLIPRWLGWGAATATVISFAVREWLVYRYSQRLWPIGYSWAPIARLITVAVVVSAGGAALSSRLSGWQLFGSHVALLAAYSLAVWFGGVLDQPQREMIARAIRSPLKAMTLLRGGNA